MELPCSEGTPTNLCVVALVVVDRCCVAANEYPPNRSARGAVLHALALRATETLEARNIRDPISLLKDASLPGFSRYVRARRSVRSLDAKQQ
jgi:hypothetical protein